MQETRNSINNIWGERTPYRGKWPVRVDQRVCEEPDKWVQSACVLCSNGCGIDIGVKDGKMVGVRGRKEDVVNFGRLGPKGLHGWVANNSKDRLTKPLIRKNGKLEEASWDEAMELIVKKSKEIIEKQTSLGIGFYTSGQLFLEEYYTLGVLGKAGLGTPHMDGNTRLCTATAAAALKISFGSDGQPGSYSDLDTTDCILHFGHNIASQQTVLWMRILDRLAGPNPPKIIVIDPRKTFTAEKATVHLAPKPGTNVPVMNGLLNLIIEAGHINKEYINAHTVGFEDLKKIVSKWPPERVEEVTGVPASKLREAAHILGTTKSLVSSVLQGVYQSMQATAAAVQINNLHLIRGLIGIEGSGIYQMNGQPTSQNTRECGADGDLPGFRNWGNKEHVQQLADLWNVELDKIPHWSPPTHAMQIWRFAETGSIKMLWISGTNPAVSMPELSRVRKILQKEDLFVIAQDAFHTETTRYADVVLPAAIWGEKTGCYTNVGRTVHISHKAIEPPGEAKSDLDIFIDYSRRMGFKDKDGTGLIKWNTAEEAFEAWKECTRGRPCDYTGMSYAKLTGGAGIQWPCNEKYPDGTPHIYTDGVFNTASDYCEAYGHDFDTGAAVTEEEYKAIDPKGKAFLKGADYVPPHEVPDEEYPLWLTTGRLVYHFHTRTKTGRSKDLQDAAPDGYVQISEQDATKYGIAEGDMLEVTSRRGKVVEPAKIGGIEPGTVFIPFHYGSWDNDDRPRAANELTITEWDAVSKQPHFKYAAVKINKTNGFLHKVSDVFDTIKDKFKQEEA
ncbi:molybdopterin oxidoreductase family protein [Segetibacter aerophilus]|uniref:Molybdopterin oxidoreductase n=1 Tax=Segetibacter aerophilus TaxID=670293 RepID=A0A512B9Q2_9BACT|nr:nitrate reductase [Segetibacter aerophilus]GEO08685.1 molybdopterin oxidoreductase [Segetibacter aerophilus]